MREEERKMGRFKERVWASSIRFGLETKWVGLRVLDINRFQQSGRIHNIIPP